MSITETHTAVTHSPVAAFPSADSCELAAHVLWAGHDPDPAGVSLALAGHLALAASVGVAPGALILHRRLKPLGREVADLYTGPATALLDGDAFDSSAADAKLLLAGVPLAGHPVVARVEREPERISRWWSARSRSRLVRTLATVDWAPIFLIPGTRPGMVTLTYPGDWETVAPSADDAKTHLRRFHERLRRLYKRLDLPDPPGLWKLEFQRRGAPHFHVYLACPVGKVRMAGEMVTFATWVSHAWAAVVDHPDFDERRKHLSAGTGVDFAEGARCSDPKRLAVYFTRHNVKGSKSKEYQHRVPDAWCGAGRWWGTWAVDRVEVEAPVTDRELVEAKRFLRGWIKSQGRTFPKQVTRGVSSNGVVRKRWVTRRYEVVSLRQSRGGFVLVNDGPAAAAMLSTFLTSVRANAPS